MKLEWGNMARRSASMDETTDENGPTDLELEGLIQLKLKE